jgi:hypothetical protein
MQIRDWLPVILSAAIAACDPAVHAKGVVRNATGEAVAGATVALWIADDPRVEKVRSDTDGHFEITRFGSQDDSVVVQACHERYGVARQAWANGGAIPDSVVLVVTRVPATDTVRQC